MASGSLRLAGRQATAQLEVLALGDLEGGAQPSDRLAARRGDTVTASLTPAMPRILERGALISPCGRYRYRLTRRWGDPDAPTVVWCCLNPSSADAFVDDRTVRRIVGFTDRWGFQSLQVVNLFALRATRPAALTTSSHPVGPGNDQALLAAVDTAALVIAAWGAHPRAACRARQVLQLLDEHRGSAARALMCLGRTAAGHPRHPLYLRRDTPLEVFA